MFTTVPLLGWAKPVETNPLRWRDKTKANISVSAAGPISNFILMAIAFITLKVMFLTQVIMLNGRYQNLYDVLVPVPGQAGFMEPLVMMLSIMLILNLALGIFNLFPIPPLDGSHVIRHFLPESVLRVYDSIGWFGLLALVYFGGNFLGMLITPALDFFDFLLVRI